MKRNSKQLTNQLIELRNAIKRKYKLFKEGTEETEFLLEKQYKPIIQELRKTKPIDIKTETESVKEEDELMDYNYTDEEEEAFIPQSVSTPRVRHEPKEEDLSELVSTPSKKASTSRFIEDYFNNPLTRQYINTFIRDSADKKIIDYLYGPRYEGETLMVGNAKLDFDEEGNILIGGNNYGASEGLYELIFKKVPDKNTYKKDDLEMYKQILTATSAHKAGYESTGKLKSNKSTKYTSIIKPLFSTAKGKGLTWKSAKSRDIIHWDDANELIDRLRHIAMSTETGNRVHGNEILSIVEELREAGYIKGAGNSRFRALLQ